MKKKYKLSEEEKKVLGFDSKNIKIKKMLNSECLSKEDIARVLELYGL